MRNSVPLKLFLVACLTVFLSTAARTDTNPPWRDWQSTLLRDHALAGRIWSVQGKGFVAPEILAEAVASARFVLLGEVHDNPDHHRLQAWLIEKSAANRKPALVMEMIAQDQAPALRGYLDSPRADAAGLGKALKWETRGWPDWAIYQPIADAAFRLNLPLMAGDVDRPTLKNVGRNGINVLSPERRSSLLLDKPLGTTLETALLDELYESHCKLMPRNALGGMLNVQRLRDAVLADSLLKAAGDGSAVLVAGNGHLHADRAVPWYLRARMPDARIVTVLLIEVDKTSDVPADLLPSSSGGTPIADFVWFTPRVDRQDPCEQLRERFNKHR